MQRYVPISVALIANAVPNEISIVGGIKLTL
jgi:hypothetical protein